MEHPKDLMAQATAVIREQLMGRLREESTPENLIEYMKAQTGGGDDIVRAFREMPPSETGEALLLLQAQFLIQQEVFGEALAQMADVVNRLLAEVARQAHAGTRADDPRRIILPGQ